MGRSGRQIKAERDTPPTRAGYDRARRAFEFAEQVRTLREQGGISQFEPARRMGTSQSAVARLEGGRTMPTLHTLERVAAALGAELVVELRAAGGRCLPPSSWPWSSEPRWSARRSAASSPPSSSPWLPPVAAAIPQIRALGTPNG